MKNNNDNELEKALDDIFGSDFIEINVDDASKKSEDKKDGFHVFIDSQKEDLSKKNINKKDAEKPLFKHEDTTYIDSNKKDEKDHLKPVLDESSEPKVNAGNDEEIPKQKKPKKKNKKFAFTFVFIFLAILVFSGLIYLGFSLTIGFEKVTICQQEASDDGYEYSDQYKITYHKNKISYVESVYSYKALNEEYEDQVDLIKDEKLSVVINSNGMSGFTYVYQVSDDSFSVNGYLDFTLFNFEEIDQINQDLMPLSYFKISSDLTYEDLVSDLESQGYTCTRSS